MKSIEYDLPREFLVLPARGFKDPAELEFLLSSTGNLLPEEGDRLEFSHLADATAVQMRYGTTEFRVHQVLLQPGFGDHPGKIGKRDPQPYAADRLVVVLQPLKGVDFGRQIAKCLELPQEKPETKAEEAGDWQFSLEKELALQREVPPLWDVLKGGGKGLVVAPKEESGTLRMAA